MLLLLFVIAVAGVVILVVAAVLHVLLLVLLLLLSTGGAVAAAGVEMLKACIFDRFLCILPGKKYSLTVEPFNSNLHQVMHLTPHIQSVTLSTAMNLNKMMVVYPD